LIVTKERWAQLGITLQLVIIVRALGEVYRLRHVQGADLYAGVAMPYVGGALLATGFCWVTVTLYFFRRYTLSACIAPVAIIVLLAHKVVMIGR
jgi:hypothetical protein